MFLNLFPSKQMIFSAALTALLISPAQADNHFHGGGGRSSPGRSSGGYRSTPASRPSSPSSYPSMGSGYRPAPTPYRSAPNPSGYRPAPSNGGYHPTQGGGYYRGTPAYRPNVVVRGNTTYRYNYSNHGNTYVMNRTYVRGGVTVARNYSGYRWGGGIYYGYTPYYRYDRRYYGYLYTPWYTPVSYRWWWAGAPWYGYYSYYFRPYTVYQSPSYWLTDYVLAQLLAEQYAIAAANAANAEARYEAERAMLDEQMKTQIRLQVEASLRAHEQQQPVQLGALLNDLNHLFAISETITASQADGSTCSLSGGDLIRLTARPAETDQAAMMAVVTSKRGSCAAGSQVWVSLTDLQAFENDFNEQLEEGMQKMQTSVPGATQQ